jgi:chemotaxis protein histidine kinase CheA
MAPLIVLDCAPHQVRSSREKRDAIHEAEAALRRAQAEARAAEERCVTFEARLREAECARTKGADEAAAREARASLEIRELERRAVLAEARAREAASDAAMAQTALEQAKTMEELWFEQREVLLNEVEAHRKGEELAADSETARKGLWKARAEELSRELAIKASEAHAHQKRAHALQKQMQRAADEAAALQAMQKERERLVEERPPPKPPPSTVVMTPLGLVTVPAPATRAVVAGAAFPSPQSAGVDSPASAGAGEGGFAGFARASTAQGFGVGWLLEPHARQAKLEAQTEHFRSLLVRERLGRMRLHRLHAIWRAWGSLVQTTRRRRGKRLATLKLVADVADAAAAASGKAVQDYGEWWRRDVGGRKKKTARSRAQVAGDGLAYRTVF